MSPHPSTMQVVAEQVRHERIEAARRAPLGCLAKSHRHSARSPRVHTWIGMLLVVLGYRLQRAPPSSHIPIYIQPHEEGSES